MLPQHSKNSMSSISILLKEFGIKYPEFWFLLAAALFLPPFGKNPGILLVMLLNSSVFVREIKGVKKNSIVVFACGIYFFCFVWEFQGCVKIVVVQVENGVFSSF